MSALTRRRWLARLGFGTFALLGLGLATLPPASAQSRTLAMLADVPALVPAPYHPQAATAVYSASLYDGQPFAHESGGAHYWH
ncbi:MAG TPA: hypothetical protein VG308_15720 [Stellaceae bacterium]|nr:hypothetical protein [Stellaceae bacterium]